MNKQGHRIVIEPHKTAGHYWAELWKHRELPYFLTWRDVLIRYKQTVIGIAWSILRPLITIVVFTLMGTLFNINDYGTNRALMTIAIAAVLRTVVLLTRLRWARESSSAPEHPADQKGVPGRPL